MAGTDLLHPPAGKKPGYEPRDVDIKKVGWLAVGIVALSLFAVVAMYFLFDHLAARETRNQPRSRTLVPRDVNALPPAPRLQSNPVVDLKTHRREESQKADAYRWLDRKAGRVAIPVARALELIEARGLPAARPQPSAAPAAPEAAVEAPGTEPAGTQAPHGEAR
jgi:hypothetical protein